MYIFYIFDLRDILVLMIVTLPYIMVNKDFVNFSLPLCVNKFSFAQTQLKIIRNFSNEAFLCLFFIFTRVCHVNDTS